MSPDRDIMSQKNFQENIDGLMTLPNTVRDKIFSHKNLQPVMKIENKTYRKTVPS